MAQAMRLTLAAVVLCAAFVAPALAARQLKQSSGTINFPGCTFLGDSEIARNKDFSSLYTALQASGLNDSLSNLDGPATLFAPTNEAFEEFLAAANITAEDALASPYNRIVLEYHLIPGAIMSESAFADGEVLPTSLRGSNLTIVTDEVNNTEYITVVGYASEATIVTPAAYACNLVIYGIDGVLVPEDVIYPFDSEVLLSYLTETLAPGFAEVPLNLVMAAVQSGQTNVVAEAELTAINGGYLQQIVALYEEAAGNQEALLALDAVANEVIQMSSCAKVTPLIQQVPSDQDLQESEATRMTVAQQYPALAQCVNQVRG
uniref:Putative extracellular protein TR9_002 n=1 Tax=Trebouxia lynnae TaxID=1825957 RepID=A0A7L9QEB3_9CHLO|nr:putative extracellular protein TR9_002 [Trebouxia lynnae]